VDFGDLFSGFSMAGKSLSRQVVFRKGCFHSADVLFTGKAVDCLRTRLAVRLPWRGSQHIVDEAFVGSHLRQSHNFVNTFSFGFLQTGMQDYFCGFFAERCQKKLPNHDFNHCTA